MIVQKKLDVFHRKILDWYEIYGRKTLPWRTLNISQDERLKGIDEAYGVYISEIMLQQTQVNRVLESYYFTFLQKFPNLESLANASEDELLKSWQGLGYYSRARNLKLCAKECVQKFDSRLPKEPEDLCKLKGIGAYTAGAIACFGYKKPVSFVDSNIKRIICRLFSLQNPNQKKLEQISKQLLNKKHSFNHNQALLDIGALICTSKNPKCGICPLYEFCTAKFDVQNYPKSIKKKYEKIELNLLIIWKDGKLALEKSKTKLYFNLYNFVQISPNEVSNFEFLGEFFHSYTKYRLKVRVYFTSNFKDVNILFFSLKECEELALSNLSTKALTLFKKVKLEI